MIYKKIPLDASDTNAYLECYIADPVGDFVRDALLVIPGGGYASVCSDREGEPIALAFMPHGFNSFVLHYSVGKKPFPIQLVQASKAILHIKENAKEYNIDSERVFAVGFSAGGHLAASLGTMWELADIYKEAPMPHGINRPKGMMLIYPVISAKYETESFVNLWHGCPTDEEKGKVSIENQVSEKTCPAFIMHTANDQRVDIRHSLVMMDALATHGISFEAHIYPDAPHGVALGNRITKCGVDKWENPAIAKWVEQAAYWAKNMK